ncbi:MAG: hypothetical protein GXN95_02900 [Methanococci archaeon]|nr:hypothetical protein [Methanococci archaeon]
MKKIVILTLMILVAGLSFSDALNYKYTSSIPITFVKLSDANAKEIDRLLNSNALVVFCVDSDNINEDVMLKLGIKRYSSSKIPDYGNYTYITKDGIIFVYPKYYVYREKDGTLIYNPPKYENNSKYEFVKPYKIKIPNNTEIPNYDGYVLIQNSTFILYPKKYITVGKDGEIYFNPPKNESNDYYYKYTYTPHENCIPNYYNYIFVDKNDVFLIYPKKYVYQDKDGVLIFKPPVNVSSPPVYKLNYKRIGDGVYEIKKNKLLILYPTSLNDKSTLDIIGSYIAKNGGVFAYINKVPPYYKHILATGVAVDKIIPDEDGSYAVDVAGRKIKVDVLNENILNSKLKQIKALKAFGINVSYIITGSEGITLVEKENVNLDELRDLYYDYWFKKPWTNYTHIYFNPYTEEDNLKYLNGSYDLLALSYYPLIYTDKAPETFRNDPIGNYYPKVISYKGTGDYGYWEEGAKSEVEYYHVDQGEPYWNGKANEPSKWYYEGKPVSPEIESEMWEKYEYFNHWFVKNYAYALASGCDGLFLESSDKYLVDAIFGIDNENLSWRLDIKNRVDYAVVPGEKGFEVINGIPVIRVPNPLKDVYGVNVVKTTYIPPKDEDFGIYISDIRNYSPSLIMQLKENATDIVSFRNLANWLYNYNKNSIHYKGKFLLIKNNTGIKITVFKKDFNGKYKYEEFNREECKYVIVNPPKIVILD